MLYCLSISLEETMSNPVLRTLFGTVELRPVAAPKDGMQVFVLLPDLDELLGVPGFGLRDPIRVRISAPDVIPISLLLH